MDAIKLEINNELADRIKRYNPEAKLKIHKSLKNKYRKVIIQKCKKWKCLEEKTLLDFSRDKNIILDKKKVLELSLNDEQTFEQYKQMNANLWLNTHEMSDVHLIAMRSVVTYALTLNEVKDALWEGFNGLLEAETVMTNLHQLLGLPDYKIDINNYINSM